MSHKPIHRKTWYFRIRQSLMAAARSVLKTTDPVKAEMLRSTHQEISRREFKRVRYGSTA